MTTFPKFKTVTLTPNGIISVFTLADAWKSGTLLIRYNGEIFYEYLESLTNNFQINFDFAPETDDELIVSYFKASQPNVLNAVQYLTTKQLRDLTNVTGLSTLTSTQMRALIRRAEQYIDSICGGWEKYYESNVDTNIFSRQRRTFPRLEDDPIYLDDIALPYSPVPQAITTATLYAVENLFLAEAQIEADDGAGSVISARLGDFSYQMAAGKKLVSQDKVKIMGPNA